MERPSDEWFDTLNFVQKSNIIELLIGDHQCPLCGCAYDDEATHLVRERSNVITLSVQCHCCGIGSLVSVEREARLSPACELTPVERAFFAYLRPINREDVAHMRTLLAAHSGDLRALLR
jgi:hypothetical protein